MRIRSPSGWGLRKRVGEAAAAPLYANGKPQAGRPRARTPNSRRRSRCQRGADPFPRRNNRDESINRSRIPEGGSFEMPFPAAGLRQIVSRETFVPTIALLRKADKTRQDTAGAASRQRQPMHPPALRMAKKHRIRKDEAHRTRPVRLVGIQPLPRPAAMPKQARLRTRNPLRYFRIQPLFAIRSGGMRPRTAEGGREGGREGRARLTRDRAPARRTGRTRG